MVIADKGILFTDLISCIKDGWLFTAGLTKNPAIYMLFSVAIYIQIGGNRLWAMLELAVSNTDLRVSIL